MIKDLIKRLNKYCSENNVYSLDNLSLKLWNELERYKLEYIATVNTDEHRWHILAENVYRMCVDGTNYYLGVWEVETLKSEGMSISDCGHQLIFFEMEEYTTVSYRRKADSCT